MPSQSRHSLRWGDPERDRREEKARLSDTQKKGGKEGRKAGKKTDRRENKEGKKGRRRKEGEGRPKTT